MLQSDKRWIQTFVVCMFLIVGSGQNEENQVTDDVLPGSCDLDPKMNPTDCRDTFGKTDDVIESRVVPHNTTCILPYGEDDVYNVACQEGILIISTPEDINLLRINRQKTGQLSTAIASSNQKRNRRSFTETGAMIGSVFGPVGTAVGAVIGVVGDFFCAIFCHHDDPPPPNKPPRITKQAALTTGTPIIAAEGKTTATVSWEPPTMTDPEDKRINVVTSPSNYKSSGGYSEGTYTVYFVGTDSGGLSATAYLSFQVKVVRCSFPSWPENGHIDCGGKDVIYGTVCNVKCKSGYNVDEGHKMSLQCGKNGQWNPTIPPDCKPKACAKAPTIPHGGIQCLNNKKVHGGLCEAVCDDGYQVHGMHIMGCDENGKWGTPPVCKDVKPPRFYECPNDMQVYIDSTNNTAKVTWEIPEGVDNSKEQVIITETHGYKPGQRFEAGSYTVKYTIEDKERNRGDSCVFNLQVLTISCSPPNLHVTGGDHLKYECPNSYRLGAECSMACMSGYPMGGVDKIQCLSDNKSHPPKLDWTWEAGELAPFCKETNCSRDALNEPINGALACSQWTHGQMCQMQCSDGFDIPNIGDGLFVCGRSTGKWRPPGRVPDCNTKIDVNNIHLPNEFYYFTGKCNSSTENLNQIRENFVQALNSSKFFEGCVGVPECQSKFVDVTCGPVLSRRKRGLEFKVYRRSARGFAYRLQFELILPYKPESGKSADEIFAANEDILYRMSDVIQKEADAGHFDLHIGDLSVESDSYGPGSPSMVCPSGTIPRMESGSCVGCPKGSYATKAGRCVECPIGMYQNSSNSMACETCPPNTNTTETGAENITQCLEYCAAGDFSPNMLAPCTKCPSNSYQPLEKSTSCIKCESNKRSNSDGAISKSQCKEYDVQLNNIKAKIESKLNHDVITIFMWIYISNTNTEAGIEIENDTKLALKFTPWIIVEESGQNVSTGQTIQFGTWTNIALIIDKPSNELIFYTNGKAVFINSSLSITKSHVLETNDFIGLYGDIKISAFSIIPRKASSAEVLTWSKTCSPSISGTIFTMDDIAEADSVTIVVPSICDAVNECTSSPCGNHTCVNKLDGYECLCSGGFSGNQCEIAPDYCKTNNCKNGATCVNGTGNYTCDCPYGYRGDLCEIKAVDGEWSAWSDWTGCSKSCGGGIATKTRRCDSPPPDPEGKQCLGNSSEYKSCEEEKCPECSMLRRTYGLSIICNKTSELQYCTISCQVGLYFTSPPLPYYECGVATGYKWNHQNEENPSGRLPSCSIFEPPTEMGVNFEGNYDSVPCTPSSKKQIKESIEIQLSTLDCRKAGTCVTNVQEPVCISSKKKRSTGSSMTVTVGLHAPVKSKGDNFNIAGLLQNNSAPSKDLVDFVRQTLELEKSAQKLMNHSMDFFQVTVDGTTHSLASGSSPLTYKPDITCPAGTVRIEVFCAVCPAGSYSDGHTVTECPRGEYQDMTGQSVCKQCPSGKTTTGVGSIHVSECSIPVPGDSSNDKDGKSNAVAIGVGVSITVTLLVLAAVAIILISKHFNQRKSSLNDSNLDLHTPTFFNMQSKPVFENQPLQMSLMNDEQ